MEDREEALDYIYKNFREGRQSRRDFLNQRGADRIAARRQRMAGYGSPSMQMQTPNMRGPPSQSNVASSPPSTIGNFTDDISTLDDESTPQNEAAPVQETVSSPPSSEPMSRETAMANLDMFMGGSGATQSTYNPTSPKPTQANVQASPDEAFSRPAEQPVEQPVQKPTTDISESLDIIDGKIPYNLDGERIPERPKPKGMGETPYKAPYERPKDSRINISEYGEPPKRPYEKPEMPFMKPSVEGYKKRPITRLKPDGGSGEAVPEKTAKLTPVKRLKPVEQQHQDAFNTAYNEMTGDEMRGINQAMNRGIDEAFAAANREAKRLGREDAKESSREPTPTPKPDEKVAEAAKKTIKPKKSNDDFMDSTEGEDPKAPRVKFGDKYATQATAAKLVRAGTHKWAGKTKDGRPQIQEVKSSKPKPESKTPRATETGKDRVRAASDRLARSGMKGDKKNESPKE